jgi:spermidine/putrescine transport system substrate-binding protein
MFATIRYFGGEWCTDDKELLKKVRDKLVEAKPSGWPWTTRVTEKLPAGDYSAVYYWNGAIDALAA